MVVLLAAIILALALHGTSTAIEAGVPPAPLPAAATAAQPAGRQVVVVSDFHMGVGADEASGRWRNYEDFRWPEQFAVFLVQIDRDGKGSTDLVVNGDLFELWQSTKDDCRAERDADYGCMEDEAVDRLAAVLRTHKATLQKMGAFARRGDNRLIVIPGNHDAALLFPSVREAALRAIDGGERVQFAAGGYWISEDKRIFIEHGHQIGRDVNRWERWPAPYLERAGKRYLQRPWGEKFVQDYFNGLEGKYPIIDNLSSEGEGFRYAFAAEGATGMAGDLAGFLKFYFFGVSWEQFTTSLGTEGQGQVPVWDIDAIRRQGSPFLAESLPSDHPFATAIREPGSERERRALEDLFSGLSDADIQTICDGRAILREVQVKAGRVPTITACPKIGGELGAIAQSLSGSGDKVLGTYLEKDECPNTKECAFDVYVYGHTHKAFQPRKLSLSSGYWKPAVINSGAWQRVVTPEHLAAIRAKKELPREGVLPGLQPEDLPPCYSYVLIKPYSAKERPLPLLRYWVGEEGHEGTAKELCEP